MSEEEKPKKLSTPLTEAEKDVLKALVKDRFEVALKSIDDALNNDCPLLSLAVVATFYDGSASHVYLVPDSAVPIMSAALYAGLEDMLERAKEVTAKEEEKIKLETERKNAN